MIAHIDADAFFASVLQRKRPDLKGKPLLALGMGGGCVIAASYEAKAKGVKTGMRLSEARKLCPRAVALASDFDEALLASRQIEEILCNRCPLVQRYSVDEWFLDLRSLIGGLPDNLKFWALEVQETVQRSVGLTVSIGIAGSKLLAKMANEYRKPAGTTIIWPQELSIETFLRDRTAQAIPGIGTRRILHSESHGWKTAWDIANADKTTIQKLFGRPGLAMQRELLGECLEPVSQESAPPKSISRTRSFQGTPDREMVYAHLLHHLTYTMLRMRREGLACRAVAVWLRNQEYTLDQKVSKLPQPVDTEEQILPYIRACFDRLFERGSRYTQIGLGLNDLQPKGAAQYCLFDDPKRSDEAEGIQRAMDNLHKRFGRESIKRGSAMSVRSANKPHLGILNE